MIPAGRVRLGVAALLAGLALPAAAQSLPPAPPSSPPVLLPPGTRPAGVQIDPGRVFGDDAPLLGGFDVLAGIGLDITASITTEWSDNITRTAEGQPLRDGFESRSDLRITPTVSVSAGRPIGRQQLFVNATVGRDFHVRNTVLDDNRLSVNGGVAWTLGARCGGRVQAGWSKRGTQRAFFEEVIPSSSERSNLFASANCRTAGGLSGNLAYDRYSIRNRTDESVAGVAPDRSFSDVNAQGLNGGLGYALASRGEVGVQGNWRKLDYPNQFIGPDLQNSTTITGANFYANYRLGASLRANGTLGFSKVNPVSPGAPNFSGTVWSAGLAYSGPRLGGSLATGRNVNGSTRGSANYRIGSFITANLSYRASERLSASAGYAWSNTENRGIDEVPDTEELSSSKSNRFFIGTDYRLNRLLSFGLDLNHNRRSSQPRDLNYKETSVLLSARASF